VIACLRKGRKCQTGRSRWNRKSEKQQRENHGQRRRRGRRCSRFPSRYSPCSPRIACDGAEEKSKENRAAERIYCVLMLTSSTQPS